MGIELGQSPGSLAGALLTPPPYRSDLPFEVPFPGFEIKWFATVHGGSQITHQSTHRNWLYPWMDLNNFVRDLRQGYLLGDLQMFTCEKFEHLAPIGRATLLIQTTGTKPYLKRCGHRHDQALSQILPACAQRESSCEPLETSWHHRSHRVEAWLYPLPKFIAYGSSAAPKPEPHQETGAEDNQ